MDMPSRRPLSPTNEPMASAASGGRRLPAQGMLDDAGLNRHHVFDLGGLPEDILATLCADSAERQLILFAHAGRRLWEQVQAMASRTAHPIDTYSVDTVEQWFALALPGAKYRFVYPHGLPAGKHIGLQRLGMLAGWHHASPFMIGIDAKWGSWFAYRAAVVADTDLPASPAEDHGHPCESCRSKACITACPAHALDTGSMETDKCRDQRLMQGSPCALNCLARCACPVGAEHRYENSQIRHGAAGSLAVMRRIHPTP